MQIVDKEIKTTHVKEWYRGTFLEVDSYAKYPESIVETVQVGW